jgi:uncharacterized membrane protein
VDLGKIENLLHKLHCASCINLYVAEFASYLLYTYVAQIHQSKIVHLYTTMNKGGITSFVALVTTEKTAKRNNAVGHGTHIYLVEDFKSLSNVICDTAYHC